MVDGQVCAYNGLAAGQKGVRGGSVACVPGPSCPHTPAARCHKDTSAGLLCRILCVSPVGVCPVPEGAPEGVGDVLASRESRGASKMTAKRRGGGAEGRDGGGLRDGGEGREREIERERKRGEREKEGK